MKPRPEEAPITNASSSAFDILGPVCKQRLVQHLQNKYAVDIWSATSSNLQDIKRAIIDVFGDAATNILMKRVYDEMDKV